MNVTKRPLFFWILRRHRGMQLFLLLVIIVSLFFRVFPLEMQKRIINEAINLKKLDLLYLYCGLYMGAVIIASLMKYFINTYQAVIGQKILIEMRQELYHHILQLPLRFFHRTQPGTVISAMTSELNAIGSFLGSALAVPAASVLTFATFLGFMLYLNPILGLLSLGIYPLEAIVIPLLQKRYNTLNRKRVLTTRAMANVVNEAASGIHEVQGNASFSLEEEKLDTFINRLYRLMRRLFIVKYGIKYSNNLFQSLGPFILFLVGGYFAIHGEFTIGALIAFLSAYEKVYDPWKEVIEYYQTYQDAKIRYQQIMDTFNLDPEYLLEAPNRSPLELEGNIAAKDVGYQLQSGLRLLDGISFQLAAGQHLALVGFSGSGKSTLSLLVSQLYSYTNGSLRIDGHEIRNMSKLDIARNVSVVAQHPFLFTGTVRDNLLYSCMAMQRTDDQLNLPDREQLFAMVNEVGLEPDVLRWGFQSVIPREKARPLVSQFLRMRTIIRKELKSHFSPTVEFYDANTFLDYSTIGVNIIFGDYHDPTLAELSHHPQFRNFIAEQELEEKLLLLGKNIALSTVSFLRDVKDDEYFFKGSPMEPEQFAHYSALVQTLEEKEINSLSQADRDSLLNLALAYIPGRHKIFTITDKLKATIVQARLCFLTDILHIDLAECQEGSLQTEISPLGQSGPPTQTSAFTPYCNSQYFFQQSLIDNILFGTVINKERLQTTLEEHAFGLFHDLGLLAEVLDIGLDFDVGSKGDRLSGGQRQKVALARAFLRQAPILILDEATASLDNHSQARIQRFIDTKLQGNTTVIAVVHRLDMVSGYDNIVVMKDGKIIEAGPYKKLMARRGTLYELVNES